MTLAEARRRKGLSQREAAEKMYLCCGSISHRENGQLFITEDELKRFCKLYGCKKSELDLVPVTKYIAAPKR